MIKEKYTKRVKQTSINIVQSNIESIREKDITKTGFRVYNDGKIGVSGALGKYDEAEMFKKAEDGLKLNIPYENEPCIDKSENMKLDSNIPEGKELINEIEIILSELRKNEDFIFSNKINITESEVSFVNDNGLDLKYCAKSVGCHIVVKEKSSKNLMDLFIPYEGRDLDKDELIKFSNEILNAYRNKVDLPDKKKMPVVFINIDMTTLLMFYKDLQGRKFGSGASIFSEFLNEKKFNENFTLYQTSHPDDVNDPFFDCEGVINNDYRYALIENGVIKSPYTDKTVSQMYNLPHTGAALCEYDEVPGLKGVPSLIAAGGEKTAKEILNGEMAAFVFIASGGDFTPEGVFGTPVQLAFLFDGDKFIGRLPELQISSNVFDMFGADFRGVSSDTLMPSMREKYMIMDMNITTI